MSTSKRINPTSFGVNLIMYALTVDTIHDAGDFKGKMTRVDFWKWQLFSRIWLIIFAVIMGIIASLTSSPSAFAGMTPAILLVLSAEPAAATRRMHDVGKSGWWQLVPFYSLYLCVQPSVKA
jgi:uncharacterized membrane protein YhaH (DUF805 family)